MTQHADRWAILALVTLFMVHPARAVIVLTGEVRAIDTQPIYVPRSNVSPVVIRYFVPEGTQVKEGEVVLRIDPGQSVSQAKEAEIQIERARAKADKEIAELQFKALQAELEQAKAESKLADARIDAALPKALISGLNYDRYQGELQRATEEATLRLHDMITAREAIKLRRCDARLEIHKLQIDRDFATWSARNAEVRAQRGGIVVHGFNQNWLGGRIDEGSSAIVGSEAGQVVSGRAVEIRAWALEADRPSLHESQNVSLDFDALPKVHAIGRITRIAGAPETRSGWGRGRYFQIDITLDAAPESQSLLPGMSVRVVPLTGRQAEGPVMRRAMLGLMLVASQTAAAATIILDGEVYAQRSSVLVPPPLDDLHKFNVTELAPDGSTVKPGQVVVIFDGSELITKLAEKSSKLQEKQRELDKIAFDHAIRTRTEHLATRQAHAELDKAQRKVEQPQELIAGVEYRKLVNARNLAKRRFLLAQQTEAAQADARAAERRLLDAETRQLQDDIELLRTGVSEMILTAPREGLFLHKSGFNGQKFDVGSQVWKGQNVAEIPDLGTLAVRAQLPERDYQQVRVGQVARVHLADSGGLFPAHVAGIGRAVRSKSSVQPIPILDVDITLDKPDVRLKPGMSVRVVVETSEALK